MVRRGGEIRKRVRRGAGHDMPGVVDGRLPGQFLEVRAARDLREHSGAGRPQWLADGPEARRASVSDKDGRRAEINECNEKTSRFTPNRTSPSSLVRDSRSCWDKLHSRASAVDSGRRDAGWLLRGSCRKV